MTLGKAFLSAFIRRNEWNRDETPYRDLPTSKAKRRRKQTYIYHFVGIYEWCWWTLLLQAWKT